MGNVYSTSPSRRITSQDRAILDMKLQRDKLQRYQKKIQTILNHEHECAKSLLSHGDKARALLALRRKKYQEFLLTSTDKQLETLEQLTQTIEFALVEKDVLYGLRQGNAVLKLIHKEMMSLSDGGVQKLMDDTAEGIRYQREVSELLAGALSNSDEDEVEDELERLEREQRVITDESTVPIPNLPSVPLEAPAPTESNQDPETEEKRQKMKARARARKEELLQISAQEPMLAS